jgi:DNA/RNA endonuclease YhcR with UshA esterase domain
MPAFAFINLKAKNIDAENLIKLSNSTSKTVKVTGTVTSCKMSDSSKVIFLNFGKNFNTSLSAIIYDVDIHSFVDAGINQPQTFFKDKKVVLEGKVRMHNGKPEVVINSPKQIKIIK